MRSRTVRGFPAHGPTTARVRAEKHYCPDAADPWIILWSQHWDGDELVLDDGMPLHPKAALKLGEALVVMAQELLEEIGPRRWKYARAGDEHKA